MKTWTGLFALLFSVAACAPLPPSPADIQAKRFDIPADKAVIYLVRPSPDLSDLTATVLLDDQIMGSTQDGTYFRWEVESGYHIIRGYAQDNASIRVNVQPGRIYFIRQSVLGTWRNTNPESYFEPMDEGRGRAAVQRSVLAG